MTSDSGVTHVASVAWRSDKMLCITTSRARTAWVFVVPETGAALIIPTLNPELARVGRRVEKQKANILDDELSWYSE